ncbi:AHH domain-containing protein [Scleromatobacter humisilvae]|uniref:AHH domain-containing protein n=1 Tax=Scleromatobacter humisilvae TaxID=2897159 RepID=A0A9X1YF69_9BURK|nr:AHH domain-containing protein [Scleromatobacter humisilvae]MCK9684908.1 AHH domain-containing protein [Scleromatobacter humisilvae]
MNVPSTNPDPGAPTPAEIGELSAAAVAASRNDPNANPRQLINAGLISQRKARIAYENGYTVPAAAQTLLANALRRDYNHRRTLSRNLVNATQEGRPASSCAHHIVALRDSEAARSRVLLFRWGIGINDADNGVFLPARSVGLPGSPNAAHHTPNHAPEYHYEVFLRLRRGTDSGGGRRELKDMKSDLLTGRMSL